AWAERTLAAARDQHRAWLAEVVGKTATVTPIGRPTGSVTALGPLAFVDRLPAVATPLQPDVDPAASTHLPPAATGELPRRNRALPLIVAFALAVMIGGIVLMMTRSSPAIVPDAPIADSSPDVAVVRPVVPVEPP